MYWLYVVIWFASKRKYCFTCRFFILLQIRCNFLLAFAAEYFKSIIKVHMVSVCQENLKLQQTRAKAREALAAARQKKLLQEAEAEGMNAAFVLQRQQRMDQIARDRQCVALHYYSVNISTITSWFVFLLDFPFEISFW